MPQPDLPFEFTNGAIPVELGKLRREEEYLLAEAYADSPVAEWALRHNEKYPEFIRPHIMYVAPDMSHRAVWVEHNGFVETPTEVLRPFSGYHVVCDCIEESIEDPHATGSMICDFVQEVLAQRAVELAKQNRIPDLLGALTEFDEDSLDYRLTFLGQELAIKAVAYLLETDKKHPESWTANRVNGLHDIETLAVYLGRSTIEVMPLLELMEGGDIIEFRADKVRLTPSQEAKIAA